MNKRSWFRQLERELSARRMPKDERKEVLNYYNEMYRDKLEDGLTESEVLREFGFPEDVADSVNSEEKRSKKREIRRVDYDDYDKDYEVKEKPRKKRKGFFATLFKILFSIIFGIISLALAIGLFVGRLALIFAGIAVMIISFTLIAENFGAFVMVIGAGFLIIAVSEFAHLLGHLTTKCYRRFVRGRA